MFYVKYHVNYHMKYHVKYHVKYQILPGTPKQVNYTWIYNNTTQSNKVFLFISGVRTIPTKYFNVSFLLTKTISKFQSYFLLMNVKV